MLETLRPATSGAAQVFDLECGQLKPGVSADLLLFDPDAKRTVESVSLYSRGRNSPRLGETLPGVVKKVIVGGVVHNLA